MRILLLISSLLMFSVACSTPQEEYKEETAEIKKDYQEELREAEEDLKEEQKEEAVDYVEESKEATVKKDQQRVDVVPEE